MDLETILRPHRKALVLAAESVLSEARGDLPDRTQLSRLIAVCGEATCAEEICNYLRYQASRQTRPWPPGFAELVIKKIEAPLKQLADAIRPYGDQDRDRARVAAWRFYAVFLTRAFTYTRQQTRQGHDDARR